MAPSDIIFSTWNLLKLILIGFVGGIVSGALGLGGGAIFNPILLSMGVPPKVSSATGMYMIIFSTSTSTALYLINGTLKI